MCLTCGCKKPKKQHHDDRNIVWSQLKDAAHAAGIDPETAAENLLSAVEHQLAKGATVDAPELSAGSVVKAEPEKRFLLMVGYSPNSMPKRGADGYLDVISPELAEKACWRFLLNGAGAGLLHKEGGADAFKVVENYIYRCDTPWVLKATDGTERTIRNGDWLIGVLCSEQTWADYKAGRYGSGSLQGSASRRAPSPETLEHLRSVA